MTQYGIAVKCSPEELKLFEEMRDLGRKEKSLRDKEIEEFCAEVFSKSRMIAAFTGMEYRNDE